MAQLRDLFQTHAVVKILDFLTLYKGFEYTRSEIAKNVGISRRTLYKVFPILENFELVKLTRSSGKIKFYRLNTENSISQYLIALADAISVFQAGKITGMDFKQFLQSDRRVKITAEVLTMRVRIEGSSSKADRIIQGIVNAKGETSTAFTDYTKDFPEETVKQEVLIPLKRKAENQKG